MNWNCCAPVRISYAKREIGPVNISRRIMDKLQKILVLVLVGCLVSTQATVHVDPETDQENRCGGAIEADSGTLSFPAPGQVIAPGAICIWTVHLQSTSTARLNFSSLDIIGDEPDCGDSAVRLYSLTNLVPADKAESYTFCNNQPPTDGNFYLSGNLVTVIYRSSQEATNAGLGFTLNWEGISFQPIPITHESTYTSASSGIIRYPIDGDYPPNQVNTWLVKTGDSTPNLELDLNVAYVNLEQCALEDPCLCDALILYQVTPNGILKENTRLCGNSSGTVLFSQGPNFILGFFTDYQDTPGEGTGFEVVYKPQLPPTTTSAPTTGPTSEPTTIRPPTENATTSCGGVVFGNQGVIEYKKDQNYDNDERCIWTVRTPYRSAIKFTVYYTLEITHDLLTFFAVNETGVYEAMVLTDSYDSPATFEVDSTVALIQFYSDYSNVFRGFTIEFEAVGPNDFRVNYFDDLNIIAETQAGPWFNRTTYPESGLYHNLELSTFVVTRPTTLPNWRLISQFNSMALERDENNECKDKIHIYIALKGGRPYGLSRWTPEEGICRLRQVPQFPDVNLQAVVTILTTDGDGRDTGFEFMWRLASPI